MTFTILNGGGNPVGSPVIENVVNDAAGGATASVFPTDPETGLVRLSYPTGLRDVYFFSMDQVFTNPAAG